MASWKLLTPKPVGLTWMNMRMNIKKLFNCNHRFWFCYKEGTRAGDRAFSAVHSKNNQQRKKTKKKADKVWYFVALKCNNYTKESVFFPTLLRHRICCSCCASCVDKVLHRVHSAASALHLWVDTRRSSTAHNHCSYEQQKEENWLEG